MKCEACITHILTTLSTQKHTPIVRNAANFTLDKVHFHQICIDTCNSQKCNDLRFIFYASFEFLKPFNVIW